MIQQEDRALTDHVSSIFKLDMKAYFSIRQIVLENGIGHHLLDERVESFTRILDADDNEKLVIFLQQEVTEDPVRCIKLLLVYNNRKSLAVSREAQHDQLNTSASFILEAPSASSASPNTTVRSIDLEGTDDIRTALSQALLFSQAN